MIPLTIQIIEIIFCFLDIILLDFYADLFLMKKNTKRKIVASILATIMIYFLTSRSYSSYATGISLAIMVCYVLQYYYDYLLRCIFVVVGYYVLTGIITLLFTSLASLISGFSSTDLINILGVRIVIVVLIKLSVFLIGKLIQKYFKETNTNSIRQSGVAYYLILAFIVLLTLYEFIYLSKSNSTQTIIQIMTFTFIVSFFTMFILLNRYYSIKSEKQEAERKLYETTLKNQSYILNAREQLESIRIRHDFKNHLIVIHNYIDQEKNKEAIDYIKSLYNSSGIKSYVNSNNLIINAILNAKILSFPDIRFIVRYDSGDYLVPHDKLTIILGNTLDNAIEATSKCSDDLKNIQIYFSQSEQYMKIYMSNTYKDDLKFVNGIPVCLKDDKHRGIGIENIIDTVSGLDGKIEFGTENNQFILKIILPLQYNQ